MSTIYSVAELAARLGITEDKVYRDVQSWPHNGMGDKIAFTSDQVREIETLVSADPANQLERIAAMHAKFEAEDAATFAGPSGYLELSRHQQPDGGASHVELFLLHQDGSVALSRSKDGGADLLLTKAEWEESSSTAMTLGVEPATKPIAPMTRPAGGVMSELASCHIFGVFYRDPHSGRATAPVSALTPGAGVSR